MVMLLKARFRTCTTWLLVIPNGVVDDLYDHLRVDFHFGPSRLYLVSEHGAGDDVIAAGAAAVASVACAAFTEVALAGPAATDIADTASSTAARNLDVISIPLSNLPALNRTSRE
jgi:hypothetical protein